MKWAKIVLSSSFYISCCTTPATAFALVHNSRLQECKELDSNSREKGEKCPSIHGQTTFPKPRLSA